MSELDLAAIAARAAAVTEETLDDYRNAPSGVGPLADEWVDKPHRLVYDLVTLLAAARTDIPALLAEVERLTAAAHKGTEFYATANAISMQRALAAEAMVAEKDAEIERLADVAETNTAAYEYAVAERDEARAALAAAGEDHLATERENGNLRAALADVTRERDEARGERPSGFWSQRQWEDWSNRLALLVPEEYEDDVAQEAIIERALADLASRGREHDDLRARVEACKAVLADRERELLDLKGPCSNAKCRLHYAHSGPCDTTIAEEE